MNPVFRNPKAAARTRKDQLGFNDDNKSLVPRLKTVFIDLSSDKVSFESLSSTKGHELKSLCEAVSASGRVKILTNGKGMK